MIELDRRTERRLVNSLNRLADIDATLDDLTAHSRTGYLIRQLTDEYNELKNDIRLYDIPIGTVLSSRDGTMTLGRFNGPRTLDVPRYRRSGISDILARDHPEVLVPESPDVAAEALGGSIDGYYRSTPVTKVTDNGSYRHMMEIISVLE